MLQSINTWFVYPSDSICGKLNNSIDFLLWSQNGIIFDKKFSYDESKMLRIAAYVFLVHKNKVPYILLFETEDDVREKKIMGLLSSWLNDEPDTISNTIKQILNNDAIIVGDHLGALWQTIKGSPLVPILPPHCNYPFARIDYYQVQLPDNVSLNLPQQYKLKAIPLMKLQAYGKAFSVIPFLLSKYELNYYIYI